MQKITPNLWFNKTAKEAAEFYVAAFPDSSITSIVTYPESKEEGLADFQLELAGEALTVEFELAGFAFTAINAGPEFTPNPSISFMVNFDPSRDDKARENLDELWGKLADGGTELMPLDSYPFSKRYGWIQDKYGVSWQLILSDPGGEPRPFIIPSLMFGNVAQNHAKEAIEFYLSVFPDSQIGATYPYEQLVAPVTAESLMYADFTLANQWFTANDSAVEQSTMFTEGISLAVVCKDQAEIDSLWEQLSAVPEAEQCGWCKDKYGVSWQIVPENMGELMEKPNAYAKMMEMHKIVIADFE